jgi:hypothetical protein
MKHRILLLFFILAPSIASIAQITEIVILTKDEIRNLRELTGSNATAQRYGDSIIVLAEKHLNHPPQPIREIFYEGLLDTHPDRIKTVKCLEDMDKVADLIYASYIRESKS